MPSKAIQHQQSDPAAAFGLAYAAVATFVVLLALEAGPSLFLPVGIAAVPYAASKRHTVTARIGAALALAGYMYAVGWSIGIYFAPTAAALLASAYYAAVPRARQRRA